ncbi:beta-lactamase family protein [Kineococcus sp. NBC_00420]|uniref:serine hydrolase domain-containing protein n=1 Tax=Kineococcus sp. NBC_00420 TaxID=2903564 RepID=UPI002E1A8FD7
MTHDELHQRLQSDLHRLTTEMHVPGVSVALACGPHVVEATSGVVNTRTGVVVTPDALFQIQSITKIFTATLVMQLIDEGLVELDAPVQTYLPQFHTADAQASARITVRHLLTHTAGFEGDLWQPTTAGPDALERFVADLVSKARQYSAPGRYFSYCNAGFGTLGRLVEVLRGAPYEQALRHHLSDPLGIEELAFSAEQALAFNTAIGHVRPTPSTPLRPTRQWSLTPPSNPAAGNQLAMSARGLLSLGRLFLTRGAARGSARGSAPDGARLLSSEAATLMLQPQLQHRPAVPTPSFQGLGWRLPRPGLAEHGGGMPGVAALLAIAPDQDLAAVVLTNSDDGARLARRLLDPLFADLAHVAPASPLRTPEAGIRVLDTEPFLGRYSTRQSCFEVTDDVEGRLWMTSHPCHEAAAMSDAAGFTPSVERNEIRRLAQDTFAVIDDRGQATRTITFLDADSDGGFHLLATERAALRVDR